MADSLQDVFRVEFEKFEVREKERKALRAALEPLLGDLRAAEDIVKGTSVCDDRDRFRVAQARTLILEVLNAVAERGDSLSENNMRAATAAMEDPS